MVDAHIVLSTQPDLNTSLVSATGSVNANVALPTQPNLNTHHMQTRFKVGIFKPKVFMASKELGIVQEAL